MIRHIHLHYYNSVFPCSNKRVDVTYKHFKECAPCSLCYWLECITKFLTGVRSIYIGLVFAPIDHDGIHPFQLSMKADWVALLLTLKRSLHASVVLEMEVRAPYNLNRNNADEYLKRVRLFESDLREKLENSRGPRDTVIVISDT